MNVGLSNLKIFPYFGGDMNSKEVSEQNLSSSLRCLNLSNNGNKYFDDSLSSTETKPFQIQYPVSPYEAANLHKAHCSKNDSGHYILEFGMRKGSGTIFGYNVSLTPTTTYGAIKVDIDVGTVAPTFGGTIYLHLSINESSNRLKTAGNEDGKETSAFDILYTTDWDNSSADWLQTKKRCLRVYQVASVKSDGSGGYDIVFEYMCNLGIADGFRCIDDSKYKVIIDSDGVSIKKEYFIYEPSYAKYEVGLAVLDDKIGSNTYTSLKTSNLNGVVELKSYYSLSDTSDNFAAGLILDHCNATETHFAKLFCNTKPTGGNLRECYLELGNDPESQSAQSEWVAQTNTDVSKIHISDGIVYLANYQEDESASKLSSSSAPIIPTKGTALWLGEGYTIFSSIAVEGEDGGSCSLLQSGSGMVSAFYGSTEGCAGGTILDLGPERVSQEDEEKYAYFSRIYTREGDTVVGAITVEEKETEPDITSTYVLNLSTQNKCFLLGAVQDGIQDLSATLGGTFEKIGSEVAQDSITEEHPSHLLPYSQLQQESDNVSFYLWKNDTQYNSLKIKPTEVYGLIGNDTLINSIDFYLSYRKARITTYYTGTEDRTQYTYKDNLSLGWVSSWDTAYMTNDHERDTDGETSSDLAYRDKSHKCLELFGGNGTETSDSFQLYMEKWRYLYNNQYYSRATTKTLSFHYLPRFGANQSDGAYAQFITYSTENRTSISDYATTKWNTSGCATLLHSGTYSVSKFDANGLMRYSSIYIFPRKNTWSPNTIYLDCRRYTPKSGNNLVSGYCRLWVSEPNLPAFEGSTTYKGGIRIDLNQKSSYYDTGITPRAGWWMHWYEIVSGTIKEKVLDVYATLLKVTTIEDENEELKSRIDSLENKLSMIEEKLSKLSI